MLVSSTGGNPDSREGRLAIDQLLTSLKSLSDPIGLGERKLLTRSFKELRHAFRVFAGHPPTRRVSIFGSARTPADHPDYRAAVEFSRLMAQQGWLAITGAGDGIMKAGHEGPGAESSFGLAIRLPFETTANSVIAGSDRLLHFQYFFTRKLMFLSQSDAVAAFPGGFGTQDELMETLTLVQTGKSHIVPIVLIAGPDSSYWDHWDRYVRDELLSGGFIGQEDTGLYYMAADPADAAAHVLRFYSNYHSSRYVRDDFVIRIKHPLRPVQVAELNEEFGFLVASGRIRQTSAYPAEGEHEDLPRIAFTHTRRSYGAVRRMIDRINDMHLDTAPMGARHHSAGV